MPRWITDNAEAITAIAALIAALGTVAYFIATLYIFKVTKTSADAAQKSADAADKSADAAQNSIALMRQQFEEQAGLGAFIVNSAIDTAVTAIEAIVQPEPLRNWNVAGNLSLIEGLLGQKSEQAISHAARANADAAKQLSSAFDLLGLARSLLEELSDCEKRAISPTSSHYRLRANRTEQTLNVALTKFLAAKAILIQPPDLPAKPPARNDNQTPKP